MVQRLMNVEIGKNLRAEPLIEEIPTEHSPESLVARLRGAPGVVLLRTALFDSPAARYSLLAARPFLSLRSFGSRCEVVTEDACRMHFGDPWRLLDELMSRYELLDAVDLPFPLGGCFGYLGYDLKNFVEPRLPRRALDDLELPDCQVGFYDSLVVFDHHLGKTWVVSTGLQPDGSRSAQRARNRLESWKVHLAAPALLQEPSRIDFRQDDLRRMRSSLSRQGFLSRVRRVKEYIRAGDIYQVNLAQRLELADSLGAWHLFENLSAVSPAPFAAYVDCGEFQLVSSSPELFLRLSGSQVQTRPIKGTRARSSDPTEDARLTYELQTSAKETAELVMITDLLRNDLGKVCEFGSVQVPELIRLERYAQVQHLVSTVEGRLRPGVTHLDALAACFPGGSITGAPKFRAMEIIDELEPVTRGPYTGALGYLGFNRESQLSIIIRAAVCSPGATWFHTGAGIVADSEPAAEYEETLAKARGFLKALRVGGAKKDQIEDEGDDEEEKNRQPFGDERRSRK